MNRIYGVCLIALFLISCLSPRKVVQNPETDQKSIWVDSIYSTMSVSEKVGQLFMIAAYSNRSEAHSDTIQKLIRQHGIGGLIFFQGGPVRQANLTNTYQSLSKVPLLIGIDGEWGLNMRLDSTARFPYNMTLGAIQNDEIIRDIGAQIGKHCKRMGIHLNFAPDVDINTNASNPIIGVRSFGEDKFNVTNKAIAFTLGMQNEDVIACAKHFPGHGDPAMDSHKTLPTVSFSKERIDAVELYPYKELFKMDIGGVMVAHLNVPSLEPVDGLPSSLSKAIVTNLLKDDLGFKNLIFTDALNMKGAANYKEPGDIDLAAFDAGNDVLLFTENAPKGISKIIEAFHNGVISEARLSHSVKKILGAKFDSDLHQFQPIETTNLIADLNDDKNRLLNEEAFSAAVAIVKNNQQLIPLASSKREKIAFVKLGDGKSDVFYNGLKTDLIIDDLSDLDSAALLEALQKYDKVILSYHRQNYRLTKEISVEDQALIEAISEKNKVILTLFASQYALRQLDFKNIESVMMVYENAEEAQKVGAAIILGKKEASGKLPASINAEFTAK